MNKPRNDLARAANALLHHDRISTLRSDEIALVKHIALKRVEPDEYHWRQLSRLRRKVRSGDALAAVPGGGAA